MLTLYGIRNCDTCRKAWKWLEARGVEYRFHDVRRDGLDRETADAWLEAVGEDRLVNRRGRSWRALPEATRNAIDATRLPPLLVEEPTLIKRPVVRWPDGDVTVGFDAGEWERRVS